jgi:hypothetical protein
MRMTGTELRNLLLSDPQVYLHYTDDQGLKQIHAEGVIRTNRKFTVYFSREPFDKAMANICLFLSQPTHADRGSHVIALRIDPGIKMETNGYFEFWTTQTVRLMQHEVLYSGQNPF